MPMLPPHHSALCDADAGRSRHLVSRKRPRVEKLPLSLPRFAWSRLWRRSTSLHLTSFHSPGLLFLLRASLCACALGCSAATIAGANVRFDRSGKPTNALLVEHSSAFSPTDRPTGAMPSKSRCSGESEPFDRQAGRHNSYLSTTSCWSSRCSSSSGGKGGASVGQCEPQLLQCNGRSSSSSGGNNNGADSKHRSQWRQTIGEEEAPSALFGRRSKCGRHCCCTNEGPNEHERTNGRGGKEN